ncbi:MAG TPA: hypothetical protein VLT45_11275 [Kofleriaceae bacterium]|nr:hypothetical protein [Kofleriaceae bacterium]
MLTKALPLVLLAACAAEVDRSPEPASPTTPIAFHQDGTLVAAGGTLTITIPSDVSVGFSATADNAEVTPASITWPNMTKPEYEVRSRAAGPGTFAIVTSQGIAAGTFEAADVARTVIDDQCHVTLLDATGRALVDDSIPALDPQCEATRH